MLQALQLARVDDGGVVGVVGDARVQPAYGTLVGVAESLQALAWHQHVVWGDAGLAGVEGLAEGDALGGAVQRYVGRDYGWRLAAQLQGDGGQVVRGSQHYLAPHAGGAGEQQVIERQAGKGLAYLDLAEHHADQIGGEHLLQQLLERLASGRRGFAELEHDPVAGGQGAGQRADGKEQRVVPRHDDADHAQGLVAYLSAGRLEGQADLAPAGAHPALQVLFGVAQALHRGQQLGQQGLVGAAPLKVLADCLDQFGLAGQQGFPQAFQPLAPLRRRWQWVAGKSLALGGERRRKVEVGLHRGQGTGRVHGGVESGQGIPRAYTLICTMVRIFPRCRAVHSIANTP
ncbi:hypothetical protein D3C72_1090560 [compost metagenome]